jgi:hypothetical protein
MNANQYNASTKARLELAEQERLQKRAKRIAELNRIHEHQVILGETPIDVLATVNAEEAAEREKLTKDQDLATKVSLLTGAEVKPQSIAPIPIGGGQRTNERSQQAIAESQKLLNQ